MLSSRIQDMKPSIKKAIQFISTLALLSFAACDKSATPEEIVNRASNVGACLEAETYIHDVVQKSVEVSGSIPSGHEVLDAFQTLLGEKSELSELEDRQKEELLSAFSRLYSILENEVDQSVSIKETLSSLGKLEYGLHPNESLQKSYSEAIANYRSRK